MMKLKPITIIKICIDACMTVLFLLLMSYHLLPDMAHEVIGTSLFALFLAHNALNWRWYKNLPHGKYTPVRILQTVINFLLWVAMICCIISALCISGYVFAFLDLSAARMGRAMHLCATGWAFVLASLHLGLHWQMFISMALNAAKPSDKVRNIGKWISRGILATICVCGIYVFITRALWEELFLLTEFKWFDYEKLLAVYVLENITLMTLFATMTYYAKLLMSHLHAKRLRAASENK